MDKLVKPFRFFCIIACVALCTVLYATTIYRLQISERDKYVDNADASLTVTTTRTTAVRGNILDRYGRVLVSSNECYNLTINTGELFALDDPNSAILELVRITQNYNSDYTDTLPITKEAPFEYIDNMSVLQRTLLDAFIKENKLDTDATAVEVLACMRTRYKIDSNYSSEEMRIIAGIRYEINIRYLISTSDYVFAEDVGTDLILHLKENGVVGFNVEVSYARRYDTEYACHLLGYIGLMDAEEYAGYSKLGYSMDAYVGKSGVEKQFEEYLHGSGGVEKKTTTQSGALIKSEYTTEPKPGSNVYLTIDIELQAAAEKALGNFIESINASRSTEQEKSTGGAVCVVKCDTGEPLAISSYPNYDLSTFTKNYKELSEDPSNPLFDRALLGTYSPGSTFKMVTAMAALNTGTVTTGTTVYDAGKFTKYASSGYAPTCTAYPGSHGSVNVVNAIQVSCNYFFYYVGDLMGIRNLADYAVKFGLGQATGIELAESLGSVATPEYKSSAFNEDWYVGDTLQAAIGQSYNQFTPLQIACYIATIANGGTRYSASILKQVESFDHSEILYTREPDVLGLVEAPTEYWDAIQEGMYEVANTSSGTAHSTFLGYSVKVAAKTGTVQTGNTLNNAVFVCYAPADNPEIAVSVVVEKGGSGSSIAAIAREVLDYYFSSQESDEASLEGENTLLK